MRTRTGLPGACGFLVALVILISGCSTPEPDCARPDVFCVGLVTNVGKLNDQAFNQLAWSAVQQAQTDLGAHVAYIQTVAARDYDKNIATFAAANYDVIITVGYPQSKATADAAARYPDIDFIGVDQSQVLDRRLPPNLATLAFPEDQAGFLAGALAAQMTRTGKIGAVCGPDWFSPAWRYCEGFKAGAAYINPALEVTVDYHNELGFKDSLNDPAWDVITANTLIDNGADVLFGAGGGDTNGTVTAAAVRSIYAIGVNTDQFLTLGPERQVLLSSVVKQITPAVSDLIKAAQQGSMPTGNIPGQVGFAPYHALLGRVPGAVRGKMKEIQAALVSGTLETGVLPSKP